jgi:hypothetical protein
MLFLIIYIGRLKFFSFSLAPSQKSLPITGLVNAGKPGGTGCAPRESVGNTMLCTLVDKSLSSFK